MFLSLNSGPLRVQQKEDCAPCLSLQTFNYHSALLLQCVVWGDNKRRRRHAGQGKSTKPYVPIRRGVSGSIWAIANAVAVEARVKAFVHSTLSTSEANKEQCIESTQFALSQHCFTSFNSAERVTFYRSAFCPHSAIASCIVCPRFDSLCLVSSKGVKKCEP